MEMNKQVVVIIGRPNVGKSTLFNRIARKRISIVESEPGITRDRIHSDCEWQGRGFLLVDTGGLWFEEDDLGAAVRRQVEIAIEEADILLFVVDAREGVTAADREIAGLLYRAQKPVILVANKAESPEAAANIVEFYELGMQGPPVPVSAEHGKNIGDLLDAVIASFPGDTGKEDEGVVTRVAICGRPNVGKSSLVNRILGEDRVIVNEQPGTTRDAVDTLVEWKGRQYVLIDTAGIRRKSRIHDPVEHYSVLRALKAVERSDVSLTMLDATEGLADQDKKIAGFVHESGKALILVINKWDLIEKETGTMSSYERDIRRQLGFLHYAPMIFISAKTGQRLPKLLDLIDYVNEQSVIRIPTGRLNSIIQDAVQRHHPPASKGRRLKLRYCVQSGVKPPRFKLFVNDTELFHFSYRRYLENRLRDAYGFHGNPIRWTVSG